MLALMAVTLSLVSALVPMIGEDTDATTTIGNAASWEGDYTVTITLSSSNPVSVSSVTGTGTFANRATMITSSGAGSYGFDSHGYGPFGSFYAAFDTDGTMICHLDPYNLSQSINPANGVVGQTSVDITTCNVMWVLPTVYWTVSGSALTLSSSGTDADGSNAGNAYAHTIKGSDGYYHTYSFMALGVYEANNSSNTSSAGSVTASSHNIMSSSGAYQVVSMTRDQMRIAAGNTIDIDGDGNNKSDNNTFEDYSMLWNFYQWQLYRFSVLSTTGTFYAQNVFGGGNVSEGAGKLIASGHHNTSPYTYGTASAQATGVKAFIEDAWGNAMEFVDDTVWTTNSSEDAMSLWVGQNYISNIMDTSSTYNPANLYISTNTQNKTSIYTNTGNAITGTGAGSVETSVQAFAFPTGTGGSASTGTTDYFDVPKSSDSYASSLIVGGYYYNSVDDAGLSYTGCSALSTSYSRFGSRLAYVFDADPAAVKTTTVTISSNNAGYGSVSQASVANVEMGSSITVSGSSITVGDTTVTATPTTDTVQYDYGFTDWSISNGATVTEDMTITANFSRSVNNYTVTFAASPSDYGTVSPASLTVPYGTPLVISGAVLTAGSSSATATSTTATSQYNYDFSGWSVSNNTQVTGDMTVTASFTRTSGTGSDSAPYGITIRAGDSFSYTPMTNLADTEISASWSSALSGTYTEFTTTGGPGYLTWSNGVLSGSFPSTGTYYVKLDAEWGVGEGADRVTQSAEQYIMFEVVPVMTLGSDVSAAYSLSVIPNDRAIATITPTHRMDSSSTIVWTMTQTSGGEPLATDQFELSSVSGGSTVLKFKTATPAEGTYTVTVTATETYDSHSRLTFSDTVVYSISVGAATTAAPVVITTCIDDSQTSNYSGKTTSWTNGTGATWTVQSISGPKNASDTTQADTAPGLSMDDTTLNEPEWSVDVSSANANTNYGFSDSPSQTEDVYTKTVKYLATGYNTISSTATPSYDVDVSVTYNVYAKLAFIGAPSMSGLTGYSNPVNPMDVLMSVNIEAAKKVVFNWGDGKSNTLDVSMYDSNVSMAHVYERTGMYTVTVIAYNEFGNCSSTYLYSADSDMIMQAEKTFQVKDVKAVANEDANTLTLTPIVVTAVGSGTVLAYEWSYTMGEAKNVKITAENVSTLDFVINDGVPGASIILDTTKLDEKAKFTVKVTATFADGDEASKVISYNYSAEPVDIVKDYGLAILFAALFVISLVAILYFGFQTYWMYALAVVFAVLAVLMFVYHDFNGLIDAVKDLLRIE